MISLYALLQLTNGFAALIVASIFAIRVAGRMAGSEHLIFLPQAFSMVAIFNISVGTSLLFFPDNPFVVSGVYSTAVFFLFMIGPFSVRTFLFKNVRFFQVYRNYVSAAWVLGGLVTVMLLWSDFREVVIYPSSIVTWPLNSIAMWMTSAMVGLNGLVWGFLYQIRVLPYTDQFMDKLKVCSLIFIGYGGTITMIMVIMSRTEEWARIGMFSLAGVFGFAAAVFIISRAIDMSQKHLNIGNLR